MTEWIGNKSLVKAAYLKNYKVCNTLASGESFNSPSHSEQEEFLNRCGSCSPTVFVVLDV
jgi:hypothetical protein